MGLPSHEATKEDATEVALHGSLIFTLPLGSDVYFQMVDPRCVYITSLMKCRRQSHTQHVVYATVSYISLVMFIVCA